VLNNIIFSGLGAAFPRFKITNEQLSALPGFDPERVKRSTEYLAYLKVAPGTSPLNYFVGVKMGFECRYHVAPFPPRPGQEQSETALDLAVRATEAALKNAGLSAGDVGAWIVSSMLVPTSLPELSSNLKARLAGAENMAPSQTIHSGCPGFNIGLEKASQILLTNGNIRHVVVVHTETLSRYLTSNADFAPLASFGDGAGCVVVSSRETRAGQGLLGIETWQDPKFLKILTISEDANLYIDASAVRERAIFDMAFACEQILDSLGMRAADVDLFVPHQTGRTIIEPLAKQLGIPRERLYMETQRKYGNICGATVPVSLWEIQGAGRLKPGMTILSAAAGIGGSFGAFCYRT